LHGLRREHGDVEHMIATKPVAPAREARADTLQDSRATIKLDAVPLPVIETHRFDALVSIKRPNARHVVESWPPENSTSADVVMLALCVH